MADDMTCKSKQGIAPQEQLLGTMTGSRHLSIGLPAEHNGGEKRFPLTPEGVALLTKRGFRILIESGAGEGIKYSDLHYTEAGAEAVSATEVFSCDVVLKITPLNEHEASLIRPGILLLTLLQPQYQSAAVVRVLITSTDGRSEWSTVGVSSDVIDASFKALSDSIEYKILILDKQGS